MKQHVFTVFDQKASAHVNPFFLPNQALAIRSFSECANDENHQFGRHPGDFYLKEIGTFDVVSGKLEPYEVPLSLGSAAEHKVFQNKISQEQNEEVS